MQCFKNMLYAINLDEDAIGSLSEALDFAIMFKSRIHIVYVNDPMAGYRHPADKEDAIALRVRKEVPEAVLEQLDIVYASLKGAVAEEIVKYVQEQQNDLIIVGHRHRSKLYASMFDSTDVNIIDSVLLPVLVLPEKR
ncbi:MAG TPA: universal stress protein [Smithellaceae bacterium]|nr:universal stress protein [Smithellaceae bacterium]